MQAVILAGGLGTRLRSVTSLTPKCMALVNGRPFLSYLLNMLKEKGIDDVILCIGYLGEQISQYFGQGKSGGSKIRYSREKDQLLGTAGALKLAVNLLDEEFFVINGDTYLEVDYGAIYANFLGGGESALIVAFHARDGQRQDLKIDADGVVTLYDKESVENLGHVNAGVLALKRTVIDDVEAGRPVSLEKEIFPSLIQRKQMRAFVTHNQYYDIGSPDRLRVFENSMRGILLDNL
jgi:mannose-1-phosphate guanylyltransferase